MADAFEVYDECASFGEHEYAILRKHFGSMRIERIIQKAKAAQRFKNMGRWK